MKLHDLAPSRGAKHKRKRIGRGPGSGHGKTATKGHKGLKARSGGGKRPGFEGGQMPLIRRVPKYGFTNQFRTEYTIINLKSLAGLETTEAITPQLLMNEGLVRRKGELIKILAQGELTKPLVVQAHKFSKSAEAKIQAAGGGPRSFPVFERLLTSFQNIFKIPELRTRVLFTLGMLIVYRVGAHIPTPGINGEALSEFLQKQGGALLGFLDIFSGGSLSRLTIFALGIMPYISASIILQLLTVVIPHLSKLAKEGERGRKKIIQYTRFGTIVIALIQGFGIAVGLEQMNQGAFVLTPGWGFRFMTVITLCAGTGFLMWLGEQITERGIGNGISLIIFAGIVARLPAAVAQTFDLYKVGQLSFPLLVVLAVVMFAVVAAIVFLESGRRKVPVQYAKRVIGRRVYGGQSTHIPLKINTAGVIPPIFASSIIAFPATIAGFFETPWIKAIGSQLAPGSLLYTLMYVGLIVFFCFFYTAVVMNPVDMADNLKKYGGFVPGIRPGQRTSDYIYSVLTKITFAGAIYLAIVCVIPEFLIYKLNMPFYFGGTSLLIVIGVGLDTAQQIESHLLNRNYDGFLQKGKLRGRTS